MNKLLLILFVIQICAETVFAQDQPQMLLLEELHDFEEINELDGPVSHRFNFLNTGTGALAIIDVKASCGCTLPDWSKKVILPGDTGFITVEFNPYNRPGVFRKALTVVTNAVDSMSYLYIKGSVKPRPEHIIKNLPTVMGDLRIRYKSFNLGAMTNEKEFSKVFDVYNQGNQDLTFMDEIEGPENLSITFEPQTLAPDELGSMTLTYDPRSPELLGFNSHELVFYTDEESNAKKEFYVLAAVEEYFPEMSEEELANAPALAFTSTQEEFGKVDEGEIVSAMFVLTNTGKEELNIRTIRTNCVCTKVHLKSNKIASGESSELGVTFDTSGRRGNQMKMITVFSNDPLAPTQTVTIKGFVNTEE